MIAKPSLDLRKPLLAEYTRHGLPTHELDDVEATIVRLDCTKSVASLAEAMQYCAEGDARKHLIAREDPSGRFAAILRNLPNEPIQEATAATSRPPDARMTPSGLGSAANSQ